MPGRTRDSRPAVAAGVQGELEPISTCHPVARPVVEIFVANHSLDAFVVVVRGRVFPGQGKGGIEDVPDAPCPLFHG